MKIVILNAGCGSRLGDRRALHKSLTPIDGVSILGRQLDHILPTRWDLFMVIGYHGNVIQRFFDRCSFIWNPKWQTTNTAASLGLALSKLALADDYVMVINGDVVWDSGVWSDWVRGFSELNDPMPDLIALTKDARPSDLEAMKLVEEGVNDSFGYRAIKKKEFGVREAVGLYILSPRLINVYIKMTVPPTAYYEDIFNLLFSRFPELKMVEVRTKGFVQEIDTPDDLDIAIKHFSYE